MRRILTLPRVLPDGGGARLWQSPAAARCWHARRWKQSERCGWSLTQPRSVHISAFFYRGSIKMRPQLMKNPKRQLTPPAFSINSRPPGCGRNSIPVFHQGEEKFYFGKYFDKLFPCLLFVI